MPYDPEDCYISELVACLSEISEGVTWGTDTSQANHSGVLLRWPEPDGAGMCAEALHGDPVVARRKPLFLEVWR